jgi:hypothetical protein
MGERERIDYRNFFTLVRKKTWYLASIRATKAAAMGHIGFAPAKFALRDQNYKILGSPYAQELLKEPVRLSIK